MDNQTKILEAVLKNYGKLDTEFFTINNHIPEEEFKKILSELKLSDLNARNIFYWELQAEVEKQLYTNNDSERVAESVANTWNQKKEIKVNSQVVLMFIHLANLRFPNSRKAFSAVCDGDFQSHKAFSTKPNLFVDLLLRYLTSIYSKNRFLNILYVAQRVLPRFFENSSKLDVQDSFKRLNFMKKPGFLHYSGMNTYKRLIGVENLVFAEGMKEILLEVLTDEEESKDLRDLKNLLHSLPTQDKEESEVNHYLEEEAYQVNKPTKQEELSTEEIIEGSVQAATTIVEEVERQVTTTNPIELIAEASSKEQRPALLISLEHALASVQEAMNHANEPVNNQQQEHFDSIRQLNIAEDEIKRLDLALQQEREKVAQAEEKAYKKILQAVGGESGNYILSDLFEESQGITPENPKISMGRLINLFSSLSLAIGLEEHSFGFNLGETFKLQKEDLIKNYQIDGPIQSQENEIQIKLVKYGWMMNGIVIVQPLVTEVKEDN
jgi:hypothetical protein